MRISLDYDGTYTQDMPFWNMFIESAKQAGHEVVCVTMRYPHETIVMPCEVIYTGRKAKIKCAGIDVWIDDNPQWILRDS